MEMKSTQATTRLSMIKLIPQTCVCCQQDKPKVFGCLGNSKVPLHVMIQPQAEDGQDGI